MSTSEHRTEFLIVGGGVTGLAFAGAVADRDYLLCEAESELGGYCRTIQRDGFVWDYSGHFFHFRHPEIERELVERIGPDRVRKVSKRSFIQFGERWVDFPFQKNIHQLDKPDFIDCLVDLVGTLAAAADTPPENFKQMLYQRLGRGISERFLIPYNEKPPIWRTWTSTPWVASSPTPMFKPSCATSATPTMPATTRRSPIPKAAPWTTCAP